MTLISLLKVYQDFEEVYISFDIIKYRISVIDNLYTNCSNIFFFSSKYWMLSIFIKQGSSFVDSRERIELNTTRIQTLVNFNGVNNKKYIIHGNVKNYKRLDAAFSVYLTLVLRKYSTSNIYWKKKIYLNSSYTDCLLLKFYT
jgi:hypothetical protein